MVKGIYTQWRWREINSFIAVAVYTVPERVPTQTHGKWASICKCCPLFWTAFGLYLDLFSAFILFYNVELLFEFVCGPPLEPHNIEILPASDQTNEICLWYSSDTDHLWFQDWLGTCGAAGKERHRDVKVLRLKRNRWVQDKMQSTKAKEITLQSDYGDDCQGDRQMLTHQLNLSSCIKLKRTKNRLRKRMWSVKTLRLQWSF